MCVAADGLRITTPEPHNQLNSLDDTCTQAGDYYFTVDMDDLASVLSAATG